MSKKYFISMIVFFKEGGASHAKFDLRTGVFLRNDLSELEYTIVDWMIL